MANQKVTKSQEFWENVRELGIPSKALEGFEIFPTGEGFKLATPELEKMPKTPDDAFGMLCIRKNGKPTSFFLRLFHNHIKKRIEVQKDELEVLLEGKSIKNKTTPNGWVLVCWKGLPIGCGLCKDGALWLQIPKDDKNRFLSGIKRIKDFNRKYSQK